MCCRCPDVAVAGWPSGQQQRMLQQLSHGRQQTHPGPPSPDVRDGRWRNSSEGSRACLQLCLPCLGWGGFLWHHCFYPPWTTLVLHGDTCQLRLCCCPAGRSPAPITDGDALQQAPSPQTAHTPGCATLFQLATVTLTHPSPQQDFPNTSQGICRYKGFTKCKPCLGAG